MKKSQSQPLHAIEISLEELFKEEKFFGSTAWKLNPLETKLSYKVIDRYSNPKGYSITSKLHPNYQVWICNMHGTRNFLPIQIHDSFNETNLSTWTHVVNFFNAGTFNFTNTSKSGRSTQSRDCRSMINQEDTQINAFSILSSQSF